MMAATNLTIGVTQTKAFEDLICSASLYCRLQQLSTSLSALNILLSFTAFFGNFLIPVTLHEESSLHPPSKLFYRCLATTDLLVGLLVIPLVLLIGCPRFMRNGEFVDTHFLHGIQPAVSYAQYPY